MLQKGCFCLHLHFEERLQNRFFCLQPTFSAILTRKTRRIDVYWKPVCYICVIFKHNTFLQSTACKTDCFSSFLHTFWLAKSVNKTCLDGKHNVPCWPTQRVAFADEARFIAKSDALSPPFCRFSTCAIIDIIHGKMLFCLHIVSSNHPVYSRFDKFLSTPCPLPLNEEKWDKKA